MILMVNPMILQLVTIDDAEKEKKDPNRKRSIREKIAFSNLTLHRFKSYPIGSDKRATDNQNETTRTAAKHKIHAHFAFIVDQQQQQRTSIYYYSVTTSS